MKRVLSALLRGGLLVVLTATFASAHAGATAQFTGIVKDSSGGVPPGATSRSRRPTPDSRGRIHLRRLVAENR